MGQVGSPAGGMMGGPGVKDVLGEAVRSLAAEGAKMGGMLQQLAGNLNSIVAKGEQMEKGGGAGGEAQNMLKGFQTDLARLAFIAALQKAMQKAGGSGIFKLETAVNDLWVALDGVKRGQAMMLQHQVERNARLLQTMSNMMKTMHDASKNTIQNIR